MSALTPTPAETLAHAALTATIEHLRLHPGPLAPLLITNDGHVVSLPIDNHHIDTDALARQAMSALQRVAAQSQCYALVMSSSLAGSHGEQWDSLVALAADRQDVQGVIFGQRISRPAHGGVEALGPLQNLGPTINMFGLLRSSGLPVA